MSQTLWVAVAALIIAGVLIAAGALAKHTVGTERALRAAAALAIGTGCGAVIVHAIRVLTT